MRSIAAVQEPPAELSPDTFTWIVSMWNAASHLNGKHTALTTKCVEVISLTITRTTAETVEEHATLAVFEDVPCIVYNGGVVLGFQLRVSNLHCMRDLSEPLVSAWTRMHELGILGGPADTDTRHPCRAGARQGRREAADPRP